MIHASGNRNIHQNGVDHLGAHVAQLLPSRNGPNATAICSVPGIMKLSRVVEVPGMGQDSTGRGPAKRIRRESANRSIPGDH